MARVFLSHAGEDQRPTDDVQEWLLDGGHEVFLDRDLRNGIALGEEWEERLHERLRWADAVVCVVTSAYISSLWCTAEVGIARSRGCRLLPVLAESGARHPLLASLQHVDSTKNKAAARKKIAHALQLVDVAGGLGWPDDRSPFPGLRPFASDEHRAFFGRAREVAQLAAHLRTPARHVDGSVLLLVGPSGCGKSSLVRAGLLPVMADEPGWWTLPPIMPGREPTAALVRELAVAARDLDLGWSVADVRRQLDERGLAELVDDLLLAVPGRRRRRLLVVVDQFEELLTQADADERQRFAELLRPALAGPVQVMATLRPEFLDQLLVSSELAGLPTATQAMRPLRGDELRTVIEGPARLAGIKLDEGLATRLVADTGSGEALPLLAFTLAQLSEGVERGGRLLMSRYEQLGGVQGALTRQADAALNDAVSAGGRSRDKVIRELLRLVTVDEQSHPTRWRIVRDELSEPAVAELDCFVARRLLTTDIENSGVVVGVAHEAFLSAWPPLANAIDMASSALRARRGIEQAADEWVSAGQPPERLWERGQLAAALADVGARMHDRQASTERNTVSRWSRRHRTLVAERVELSNGAREFLDASTRRDKRRRRSSTTVLSILLVLAVAAAGVAIHQGATAQAQRDTAIHNQIASQADRLRAVDVSLAAQLDLVAHRMRPTPDLYTALVTMGNTALSTALAGHTDSVNSVAFSPDGRTLATGGVDQAVRLWNLADPSHPAQLGQTLASHTGSINSVAFSPDGRILATASDVVVRLWDVTDPGKPKPLGQPVVGHTKSVNEVAFSPNGRTMATGSSDKTVRLWDMTDPASPKPLGEPLAGHTKLISSVAFSPDGRTLATASWDNTTRLWDVTDSANAKPLGQPLTGHSTYYVLSVAFSPDGRTLATGSGDKTVRLWNITDPANPAPFGQPLTGHTDFVNSVVFSRDGRTLATGGGDYTVRLWNIADPANPTQLGQPLPTQATVLSVAFSPDGRFLVSGGQDHKAQLWSLPYELRTGEIGYVQKYSHTVVFSPDGRMLASGAADGTVRLWNASHPTRPVPLDQRLIGHTAYVSAVAFSPDGRILASGSDDKTVRLWNVTEPTNPAQLGQPLTGHTDSVWSVAFSPDGRTLASGDSAGGLRLWNVTDPANPTPLGDSLTSHKNSVNSVAFSPDGRTLATGSGDYTVRLWNVTDPAHPASLSEPLTEHNLFVNAVAFSPDGRTLATGSGDQTVRLWNVTNPTKTVPLGPPLSQTNPVFALAFSPDGRTVASGGSDNTVRLWDVTNPANARQLGQPLTGHTDAISGVAFSPDGQTLVSGSRDQTARLWELNVDRAIQRICATTANSLTPEEWDKYVSPDLTYRPPCHLR